jgi:Ca2+:H+ antiporter
MTSARSRERKLPAWLQPSHALQLLLVFVPAAVIAEWQHAAPLLTFSFAALAIIPLAGLMGEATETLAARLGAGLGGLPQRHVRQRGGADHRARSTPARLLRRREGEPHRLDHRQPAAGTRSLDLRRRFGRERQTFDRSAAPPAARCSCSPRSAARSGAVPQRGAARDHARRLSAAREQALERGLSLEIAIVLFLAYLLSLLFSLRTHKHLYAGEPHTAPAHERARSPWGAVLTLLVATALIAWMSELLVGVVEAASHALGLTQVFVGVIVVAIIGNAAEHSTAVFAARKNHMDLALGIAIGSSTQIALFVAPVLVFVSAFMPHGLMDLRFSLFEVLAVGLTVWVVSLVCDDGESNWLEGALLLAVYLILGIAFYFLPAGAA